MLKNDDTKLKLSFICAIYFVIVAISYILLAPYFNRIVSIIILTFVFGSIALKYKAYLFQFEKREQDGTIFAIVSSITIASAGIYNHYHFFQRNFFEILIYMFLGIFLFFVYKLFFNKINNYYNQSLAEKTESNLEFLAEMNSNSDKAKRIKKKFRKYIYLLICISIIIIFFTPLPKYHDFWGIYSISTCLYSYLIVKYMKSVQWKDY